MVSFGGSHPHLESLSAPLPQLGGQCSALPPRHMKPNTGFSRFFPGRWALLLEHPLQSCMHGIATELPIHIWARRDGSWIAWQGLLHDICFCLKSMSLCRCDHDHQSCPGPSMHRAHTVLLHASSLMQRMAVPMGCASGGP